MESLTNFAGVRQTICLSPSSGDDTAKIQAANDSIAASGERGRILLTPGTFDVVDFNWSPLVDIVGSGRGITRMKMPSGANGSAVVQTDGFATLDAAAAYTSQGSGVGGGSFDCKISNLTIDGNKENNTSGIGARIYGRHFQVLDISIENCVGDGLYTGFNGADDFSTALGALEATFESLFIYGCGGNGFTFKGPHDSIVRGLVISMAGGWGWDVLFPVNAISVNTYICSLTTPGSCGGIRTSNFGDIYGSNIIASNDSGWGALLETGGSTLSACSFGAPIGLECRANHNSIHGIVANTTTAGLRLNGALASGSFDLVFGGGNTGVWIDNGPTPSEWPSIIRLAGQASGGTLFNEGAHPIPLGVIDVAAIGKTCHHFTEAYT